MKYFFLVVAGILFSLASPLFAHGQEQIKNNSGTIKVSPAYSEIILEQAQEEVAVQIIYQNNSLQTVRLSFEALDFHQKDDNGLIGFLGRDVRDYSFALASFLTLSTNSLTIEPKKEAALTVYAKNRPDLTPGGHYAAIIARVDEGANTATGAARLTPAISSLILLRKMGGERFNLSLKDVNWPQSAIVFAYPKSIELLFQNEGNVHVVPYGRAVVKDMFNREVYIGYINESSTKVLPQSRRRIKVDLKKQMGHLPISFNTLTVSGNDSLGQVNYISRQTFLYVNPLAIALLAGIIFVFMRCKKRKRKKT